jgi:L-arabinose isomerase
MAEQMNRVKIGLFGIGLDTYWPQFKGLKDKLVGYQDRIRSGLERDGVTVVDAGLVDNLDKSASAAISSAASVDPSFYISVR